MAESDSFYLAAERRIEWLTLGLGIAAVLVVAARWGWRPAAGVGLGAGLTWLNFRWLKQGIGALVTVSTAQAGSNRPRVPLSVYLKFFGRFALLLLVVYVILLRSLFPLASVLAGLFAIVAAVMVELLFELVKGKNGTETHT
jgi:hypothetical protein